MAANGQPLTARQKKFVDAYMANGGDGKAAAIAAGYAPASAKVRASRMLDQPNVAAVITRRQNRAADAAQVTAEQVIRELAAVGFAKMTDVAEWDDQGVRAIPSSALTDEQAASIAAVTPGQFGVAVKMHGKNEALNTLARALGMLKDNLNVKTDVLDDIREMIARENDKTS